VSTVHLLSTKPIDTNIGSILNHIIAHWPSSKHTIYYDTDTPRSVNSETMHPII
jgi:hypothetical protein